jgi:hypothetical protein
MTAADGRFEFALPRDVDAVLHGSAAGSLVGVLIELDGGAPLTLALTPGAALDITLLGRERCRCAVFQGDARIEDFTLRSDRTSSVTVPVGDVRLVVYDGGETLDESMYTLERGDSESLALEIRE